MDSVAVFCHPEATVWIIEVIAKRIAAGLNRIGVPAEYVTSLPFDHSIVYYMNYAQCRATIPGSKLFTYITHIDEDWKLNLVRAQAEAGIVGVCMSEDTARRLRELTKSSNFIGLAPPAVRYKPFPPLRLLFACRLYEDGRKNISTFERVIDLLAGAGIELYIIGSGWENFIEFVRSKVQKVVYSPDFSEATYFDYIRQTELLVYCGFDEGAIAVIDYLAAGKQVLATAQGYHLDFCGSDKLHLFSGSESLFDQTQNILQARQRELLIYNRLTDWDAYCRKHIEIFTGSVKLY